MLKVAAIWKKSKNRISRRQFIEKEFKWITVDFKDLYKRLQQSSYTTVACYDNNVTILEENTFLYISADDP